VRTAKKRWEHEERCRRLSIVEYRFIVNVAWNTWVLAGVLASWQLTSYVWKAGLAQMVKLGIMISTVVGEIAKCSIMEISMYDNELYTLQLLTTV